MIQLLDRTDDEPPPRWSGPHVSLRLVEALRTLRLIPMPGARGYGCAWPPYAHDWEDLLAQQAQGELERNQQIKNRSREMPVRRDIARMEAAIYWPAQFLGNAIDLVAAVNAVAWAHALDRDSGWIAAKRGGYADTWRARHDRGCNMIARGLRLNRVPVF
jgi:hypothetical protein